MNGMIVKCLRLDSSFSLVFPLLSFYLLSPLPFYFVILLFYLLNPAAIRSMTQVICFIYLPARFPIIATPRALGASLD